MTRSSKRKFSFRYLTKMHSTELVLSLTKAPLATVIVGGKTWELPRALLAHCSSFFATALDGTPLPRIPKPIKLPDDDHRAFELFVKWLYLGEITGPSWCDAEPWVYAWALGGKFGCPIFKYLALIQLIEMHVHFLIKPHTMKAVYNASSVGSKLREWAIEQFIFEITKSNIDNDREDWMSLVGSCPEFAPEGIRGFIGTDFDDVRNPFHHGEDFLELLPFKITLQKHAGFWAVDPADEVKKQEMDTD